MTIGPDDGVTLTTAADDEAALARPASSASAEPAPTSVADRDGADTRTDDRGRDGKERDDRERRAARRGRLGSIAGLLVLIVFSFVTVGVTVATHAALSPIDEAAHIDSVFRAPSIVRTGELMIPQTLDEISCRGVADINFTPPPCGVYQAAPPAGYAIGGGGYNTADIHPPIYYDITKLVITAGGWLPLDPVTLMRLTGAFWLALGACLTWLLARRLGAGRWAAFGAGATLAAGYSVQEMSSIVNVDAMVLATGAGFALLALWAWPSRLAWWLIPLAAALVMFVKMTNIAGLVVVCLFLLIREVARPLPDPIAQGSGRVSARLTAWWSANGRSTARALGIGAVTALAAGLALVVWSAIRSARALVPGDSLPISQQFLIDHLTLQQIASQVFSFTAPTEFLPNGLSLKFIGPYGTIALVGVWAALLALTVAAWYRDRPAFAALAATVLTLATMPAVYVVLNYVASGQFFTPWFRYGFSMMPFVVAAIAAGFRRRAGGLFFAGLGGIAMISALVAL